MPSAKIFLAIGRAWHGPKNNGSKREKPLPNYSAIIENTVMFQFHAQYILHSTFLSFFVMTSLMMGWMMSCSKLSSSRSTSSKAAVLVAEIWQLVANLRRESIVLS